jgi:hypothetical protein
VDQWQVGLGDIVLGLQYPIVVRSLDRIRQARNANADWKAKWARISEIGVQDGDTAVMWLAEDASEQLSRLYVNLTGPAAPVCLCLAITPVPAKCGALLAALRAGVPVLLWCRRPAPDIRAVLSGLVGLSAVGRLKDLPRRVFHFRREAAAVGEDQEHLAHHLTLLWDDADRIPDADGPLRMPA